MYTGILYVCPKLVNKVQGLSGTASKLKVIHVPKITFTRVEMTTNHFQKDLVNKTQITNQLKQVNKNFGQNQK